MKLFSLTRQLIDIPSVTGSEQAVLEFLEQELVALGLQTERQHVSHDRWNLYAGWSDAAPVCFSSHVDTVPPFIASSEDETFIHGRGACDTKGIIAAMLMAGEALLSEGKPVCFLFVVGEETDSIGAKTAASADRQCAHIVVGEPTENHLATGHKGVLSYTINTQGRAAHSAYPEHGSSAIHALMDILTELQSADWGDSDVLGPATLNVGTIQGGSAANVFADSAQATLMLRVVDDARTRIQQTEAIVADRARIELHSWSDPQFLRTVGAFPTAAMRFGTDIPHMQGLGELLLLGPGSIHDAHTSTERISKQQQKDAVQMYIDLYNELTTPERP